MAAGEGASVALRFFRVNRPSGCGRSSTLRTLRGSGFEVPRGIPRGFSDLGGSSARAGRESGPERRPSADSDVASTQAPASAGVRVPRDRQSAWRLRPPIPRARHATRQLSDPLVEPHGIATPRRWPSLLRGEGRDRRAANPPRQAGFGHPLSSRASVTWPVASVGRPRGNRRPRRAPAEPRGQSFAVTSSRTRTIASYICSRLAGITRTSPTVVMKFVSPRQRGTTWTCRCSGSPAPAAAP